MIEMKKLFAALSVTGLMAVSAQGEALIYEPFDFDPNDVDEVSLDGNTAGLGLTGTWSGTNTYLVSSGSLAYGSLPTSGNQIGYSGGNASISATIDSSLSTAGLLDDGATLWFSVLLKSPTTAGSNPDTAFALGTNAVLGSNNVPMGDAGDGGQGIGFTIKSGQVRPSVWDAIDGTAVERSAGPSIPTETELLVVCEINWGTGGGADTIDIYLPDTDLNLGVSLVTYGTKDLNQAAFDTLSTALKTNTYGFDEIRFGATYDDVIGAGGGPVGIPGDTDNDGDIDDSDLGTSLANYTGPLDAGVGTKTAAEGDTDGDGDVDDSDLGTSLANYTGPIAVSVPEPTSLALLALGGLMAARRRRA